MSNVRGPVGAGRPQPLAGKVIAVTRAGERGAPLAEALRRYGALVHEIPLTRIEALDPAPLHLAVRDLRQYDWALLTSVNAVDHLARVVQDARMNEIMETRRLAVVGGATAAAVERLGWRVPSVQPEKSHAEGMLDAMAERSDVDGTRMLYPCAAGARDVLPQGLRALGAIVDVIPTYRSAPDPDGQVQLRALARSGVLDLVTVAAPSAVDSLLDALPPEHAARVPVACIGPVTAKAARTAGFPVKVESTAAVLEGWVREIVRAYSS